MTLTALPRPTHAPRPGRSHATRDSRAGGVLTPLPATADATPCTSRAAA